MKVSRVWEWGDCSLQPPPPTHTHTPLLKSKVCVRVVVVVVVGGGTHLVLSWSCVLRCNAVDVQFRYSFGMYCLFVFVP